VRLALKAQNSISFYCSLVKQRGARVPDKTGRGNCISPTCDAWLPFGIAARRRTWGRMSNVYTQAAPTKDVCSQQQQLHSPPPPKTNHKTIINPLPREPESNNGQNRSDSS